MKGIHRKRFRGRIATIERPDLELDVELWIDERSLTVARHDKPLGIWPIESASIDRVGSDRFVVTLGSEHSAFIARDPIAFSYEGLKAISAAKEKSKKSFSQRFKRSSKPAPSLLAILVARVQGLNHQAEEPVQAAPPVESRLAETVTPSTDLPEPVVSAEPADPYAEPESAVISAPEPPKTPRQPPGMRRHSGVLDRVRNARNGVVHEHVFTEHSTSAGLLRRVCNECGHVSIDLSE